MKKTYKIISKAAFFCFLVTALFACQQVTDVQPPEPDSGRVTVYLGNGENSSIMSRSIMPVEPGLFSRYTLSLTDGSQTITPNSSELASGNISLELPAGLWTATVAAYRTFTIPGGGTASEYKAAEGNKQFTVTAGQIASVNVEIKPLLINDSTVKGIFSYTITLPAGVTAATLSLKQSGTSYLEKNLLDAGGTSGSAEFSGGVYDLYIILAKGDLSAGTYEAVHVYPGLESPAEIDLSGVEFASQVFIMGTAEATNPAKITPPLTVTAYTDAEHTAAIEGGTATVAENGSFLVKVPVSYIGQNVYLKLSASSIAPGYSATGGTAQVTALEANGRAGVTLLLIVEATVPQNLTAVPASESSIKLEWEPVSGVTGYKVYKSTTGSDGAYIEQASVTDTTWTDTGLNLATIYYYKVAAVNGIGSAT